MEEQDFHQRIRGIYRLLFELATGNLSYRLPAALNGDDLDKLASRLNAFAAQLQLVLRKSGHVIPYYSYQNLTQLLFVLDNELSITGFNADAVKILAFAPADLFKKQFAAVLDGESGRSLGTLQPNIVGESDFHDTFRFNFRTKDKKIYPAFCTISRLLFEDMIVVSSISTDLRNIVELGDATEVRENADEQFLVRDLHDYIMDHLGEPLPTLKELSIKFNTNEFKLKDSFRHFLNTSIYQFYNEERLKRAHLLIERSTFTLKTIALMSGFNNYLTFSKAFRKRFGYAPSVVKRLAG